MKNKLYELISSLSKSEKRYIKLTISSQKGEKNYLKLFDYLESSKSYDKSEVELYFKGSSFIKHLSRVQHYLYGLILKAMRDYNAERSPRNKLYGYLYDIDFLFSKKHLQECAKLILKARNFIEENKLYDFELLVYYYQQSIYRQAAYRGMAIDDLREVYTKQYKYLIKRFNKTRFEQYQDEILYWVIYSPLSIAKNAEGVKAIKRLTKHLEKSTSKANSTESKRLLYSSLFMGHMFLANNKEGLKYGQKVYDIYISEAGIIRANPQNFINDTSNFLVALSINRKMGHFNSILEKMENSVELFEGELRQQMKEFIFYRVAYHKIRLCTYTNQLERGQKECAKIATRIQDGRFSVLSEAYTPINYAMLIFYFVHKSYEQTLDVADQILTVKDSPRKSMVFMAKIIRIMTHFEMGHFRVIPYFINSLLKEYADIGVKGEFYGIILSTFKSISLNKYRYELSDIKNIKKRIDEVFSVKSQKDDDEELITFWLESKILNKPLAQVYQQYYK